MVNMLVEHVLDACEMEYPIPFEKSTEIVREMRPGEYLKMFHRRVPYLLFDFLASCSIDYVIGFGETAPYEIIIYFPENHDELVANGVIRQGMSREAPE